MKNVLFVVAPHADEHLKICNTIAKELEECKISLQQPIETTFLITGPKSFEGAMLCRDTCLKHDLHFAIFEIESLLFSTNEQTTRID